MQELTRAARVQAVITCNGKPTADVRDRARTASDLHMMIQHDGKERDAHQWADILSKVCASAAGHPLSRKFSGTLLCALKCRDACKLRRSPVLCTG